MNEKTKNDLKFIAGILLAMVMVSAATGFFTTAFADNFLLGFVVFVLIYNMFVQSFVFGLYPTVKDGFIFLKHSISWLLVFVALDVIMFPIMLTKNGIPANLPPNALISSDIFIYKLLPEFIPFEMRYWTVYIIVPTLLLFAAYKIIPKDKFDIFVKHNV